MLLTGARLLRPEPPRGGLPALVATGHVEPLARPELWKAPVANRKARAVHRLREHQAAATCR